MKRICIRLTCLLLVGVLVSSPGSASLLDWFKMPDSLVRQFSTPQSPTIDSYAALMQQLYLLNTPQAIKLLDVEMDEYKINSLKVRVNFIPGYCDYCAKNFYVVRGRGVVADYPTNNREVVLTYSQIMKMYPYFQDGNIDFFDRWQLYAIYKLG